jgi:hypothetical protein
MKEVHHYALENAQFTQSSQKLVELLVLVFFPAIVQLENEDERK